MSFAITNYYANKAFSGVIRPEYVFKGLKEARGQNTNAFFKTPEIAKPLINNEITSSSLTSAKVYEYDLSTKKGDIIEISKQ